MPHRDNTDSGFTIVEMLIVAPLVILIIAGLISVMVLMTGNVLQSREESRQSYNVQSALAQIEADIHTATQFPSTIAPVASPQGANNDATAWNSNNTNGPLILSVNGTTQNSLNINSGNSLVYLANQPYSCGSNSSVSNQPYSLYVVYFISSGSLWRRTILPDVMQGSTDLGQPSSSNLCQMPWQKNSCSSGTTGGNCATNDDLVLSNIQSMTITPVTSGGVQIGDTISLTTQNSIAGLSATANGTVYALSNNTSPTF